MKKHTLSLILLFAAVFMNIASAQWTTGTGVVHTTDNVGIGTASPSALLDVQKTTGNPIIVINSQNSDYEPRLYLRNLNNKFAEIMYATAGAGLKIRDSAGNVALTIDQNENVGIGTTTPQSKLAVNGKITATEVEVTSTGWPDFVFSTGYKLKPLAEVEQYIQTNGHLPELPSAEDVKANGIALGENQALLLQKIEELTLYMIALSKENQALKARVDGLER